MSYLHTTDFSTPPSDMWEIIPTADWSWQATAGAARLANAGAGEAKVYLRPCHGYGDSVEFAFAPGARRSGVFTCGYIVGFEYIVVDIDFASRELVVRTHEFHKAQPRAVAQVPANFSSLKLVHEKDNLPGLPYSGSKLHVVVDGGVVASVGAIDFLPESMYMFGLKGPGEVTLSRFTISGHDRPQPEYTHLGLWQQNIRNTTAANVDALLEGVRQAAAAGVELLATPETSLTGLRPDDPELSDRDAIQQQVRRFQEGIAKIAGAPYTLIGYPDWIEGSRVEGATADWVKVNSHRWVRPDGVLGPPMAKVHSCEEGLWHGREYNLQRVGGVLTTTGICHDARYPDVWALGVMGGARLCVHPAAGGGPRGPIAPIVQGMRGLGTNFDAFYLQVNAQGGSAIVYPTTTARVRDTVLAVPPELTDASPTWPEYSNLGDGLAHARIRLWDATGCWPMRTLRSGKRRYELWSELMPQAVDV